MTAAHATPRSAFVEHVKDCKSAEEVKTRCAVLAGRPLTARAYRR